MTSTHFPVPPLWWTPQRSSWLLVALVVSLGAMPTVITVVGFQRPGSDVRLVVPLGLAIVGLQLWHSFAATRRESPGGWPWSFVALGVLVYVPMLWWFDWNWASTQYFVIASAAMHLRGRLAAVAVAVPILGTAVAALFQADFGRLSWFAVMLAVHWLVNLAIIPAGLYGAARLVRAVNELHAARGELADRAVDSERSRLSRDLHDVLGQGLTAVSLKGDLALALLPTDRVAAEAEIRSLTAIARDALHDSRQVIQARHHASLYDEVERAVGLLEAADVEVEVGLMVSAVSPEVEAVLAWATREGVTNMLRHSQVRRCVITAARRHELVWLELVNDGVGTEPAGDGTGRGLAGLAARAELLSGSMSAERLAGGRFVLRVEVPEVPDVRDVTV